MRPRSRGELRDQDRWTRETERVIELIQAVQRVLGVTNRELETRLGLSTRSLSRLFNRKMALRFEHVLAIIAALGLRWDEFFRSAYPPSGQAPSAAAKQIWEVFELPESPEAAGESAPGAAE